MESITKNRQPLRVLRAMVARAYGSDLLVDEGDDRVSELGHGWFNVAYKIRLRDGRDVVVKIAPPAAVEVMTYERGAMAVELAALDLIRARTRVPVPVVDFADQTHELCDADYFFMPFYEGANLGMVEGSLPADQRAGYEEQLGATNRELNAIRGTAFGPLAAGAGHPSWRKVFTGMLEGVLADGQRRSVDLGRWTYDDIRRVAAANEGCLDAVTEPRFVEWDLFSGNVIVADGEIVAIIDHERAFYGDPLIEGGFTATQLPAFGDPSAFLRGYGWSTFTDGERQRRALYTLHLVLIMVIETVYRGHTDATQYDWARQRLAEAMALFDAGAG